MRHTKKNKTALAVCIQEITEDGSELNLSDGFAREEIDYLHHAFIADTIVNIFDMPSTDFYLFYADLPKTRKSVETILDYLRQKLKWVHKSLGSKGRVLDYGCGTGSFVTLLHKNKWDAWGVEPNDQARSIANLNGSTRVVDSLDTLAPGQYDAITLWHVLEHIPDLEHMMTELLARLSPAGFLFVAVPNCASYDAQYYKEY